MVFHLPHASYAYKNYWLCDRCDRDFMLKKISCHQWRLETIRLETSNDVRSVARQSWSNQATSKGSDQTARMRRLVWAFAGRTYPIVGNLMSRLRYARHCLCNALYVYCRGRAVTNVGKTCGPTPCFILAINTFKLNQWR